MNPFYILASLSRLTFNNLEEINVEWANFSTSIGTRKNFYAALLFPSDNITKIEMPFSESQSAVINFNDKNLGQFCIFSKVDKSRLST